MLLFGRALKTIREQVARDLRKKGLPRRKVLAAIVQLMESTLIRVGNEEYASDNGSYGLTTLRNRHAEVKGDTVRFSFRGKSGKSHEIAIDDARTARLVKRCQALPGAELFGYRDERGKVHDLTSSHVNEYLQKIAGEEFTAKDFRTWAGTLLAMEALGKRARKKSKSPTKRAMVDAIREVAERLGNTPAICRKCYIHPGLIDEFLHGALPGYRSSTAGSTSKRTLLYRNETALLRWLKHRSN
jgi:DNA topoisomerase-1